MRRRLLLGSLLLSLLRHSRRTSLTTALILAPVHIHIVLNLQRQNIATTLLVSRTSSMAAGHMLMWVTHRHELIFAQLARASSIGQEGLHRLWIGGQHV